MDAYASQSKEAEASRYIGRIDDDLLDGFDGPGRVLSSFIHWYGIRPRMTRSLSSRASANEAKTGSR
jgi:hypothetical protein